MKLSLLKHLACPSCGKGLKLRIDKKAGKEIVEGSLSCGCGECFPIIRGIPRLLLEPLRSQVLGMNPVALDVLSKKKLNTSARFGYEWQHFSKLEKEYEEQFLDWIYPVKKSFFKNKIILDAGCGMGRHLYCAATFGAKQAIGIDLGPSVEVAYENTKHLSNAHVIQADIYHIPLKQEIQYAYSIGVLHHLPTPEKGFQSVLTQVKKGGAISAWLYGKEGNALLQIADPIRRILFSKLPLWINQVLAFLFTLPVYGIIHLYKLLGPKASFLPQYEFGIYLAKFPFRVVHSIIFDQMLAPIAFYLTKEEVEAWFKKAKLKNVQISWRNKNSWRGYGEK